MLGKNTKTEGLYTENKRRERWKRNESKIREQDKRGLQYRILHIEKC